MASPDGPLLDWHDRLFFVLMLLQDLELKGTGFAFDYSRDSLAHLEQQVMRKFSDPGQVAWPTRRT
ncbi:hypothetical protein AB0H00_11270 [Nocardia sp. NPDC023852]|uniref:hypothetical protein n=1 Tax=Nocardia sp. NPDC023852 TaxID=3154697 RepID=UPI0033C584D2